VEFEMEQALIFMFVLFMLNEKKKV